MFIKFIKQERAKRSILDSNCNLIVSTGPLEVFKLAYSSLEDIKTFTYKKVFENLIVVIKELLVQYCLGLDTIVQVSQ